MQSLNIQNSSIPSTSPLNVKRTTTNLYMLIPFILVLINWIRVAYFAFEKGDFKSELWTSTEKSFHEEKLIVLSAVFFVHSSSCTYLILLRIATRPIIYVSFFIYCLVHTCLFYNFGTLLSHNVNIVANSIQMICLIIFMLSIIGTCIWNYKFVPTASEIIREMINAYIFFPSLLLIQPLLYALTLTATCFCVVIGVLIRTIDETLQTPFYLIFNQVSNIIGCVWLTMIYFAFFRLIISGTYGTWYWTRNKQEIPNFTPMRFIWITLRYHIGSVIAGSLLTPFFNLIQVFLMLNPKLANPTENANSRFIRYLQQFYGCFGMFNDQAYIYTALRGQAFYDSATTAFNIWRRNHAKFVVIQKFIRELIFLGFIMVSTFSITFYLSLKLYIYGMCGVKPSIAQPELVLLFIFLLINSIFLTINVAMDTVLTCVLEDFEVNSTRAGSHYMSDKLKEIILENKIQ